jgi:hypothetical protein
LAFIIGLTGDVLKVAGLKTSFMGEAYTLGPMEGVTMANILKTKSMDSACMFGRIRRNTKGIGRTANNMAKVNSLTLRGNRELDYGRMESD